MDDRAHVFFVHAHAEGVGGDDDAQLAVDKALLDVGFFVGAQSGVVVRARPVLLFEVFADGFGAFAAGDEDDGAAVLVAEFALQQFVDAVFFFAVGGLLDFVGEVVAFVTAEKFVEGDAEGLGEVGADFVQYVRFGSGGEAADGGQVAAVVFFDVFGGVAVVGAEVVSPFGEAVCFVEDEAVDLPLFDGGEEAGVAELFRGNEEDADVAQGDTVEDVGAFGDAAHTVQGIDAADAVILQVFDLVHHQRLQRADDDGEAAVAVVAVEGGQLEADGFAAAGREDGQHVFARHARADDGFLSACNVFDGAEAVEAKVAFELVARVVGGLAVVAGGVAAVVVA